MSNNKNFVICGDSWFTTDLNHPGCSFGEIIADRYSLELISLARGGCSNFAINLQVNCAITLKPDFIIVGCTSWDRIDLPNIPLKTSDRSFMNWFKWPQWSQNTPGYQQPQGLLNIKYSHSSTEISSQYSQPSLETVISESINNLIWKNRYNQDSQVLEALKQYVLHIYDSGVKQQTDCWCMSDAARRLQASGIPFLMYIEPLFNHDFFDDITWLDPRYLVKYSDFSYNHYRTSNTNFHLSPKDSLDFAGHWEQRLIKEGMIGSLCYTL